eukprot:2079734-Pyramimonas_sp.AAC.1
MCARATDGRVFAIGAGAPADASEAIPVADRRCGARYLESLGLSLHLVEGETQRRPAATLPAAAP